MTVPLMIRGFTCSFLPSNFRAVDSQICLVTGAQLCVVDTVHKHHSDQQAEEINASSTWDPNVTPTTIILDLVKRKTY